MLSTAALGFRRGDNASSWLTSHNIMEKFEEVVPSSSNFEEFVGTQKAL